MFLFKRIIFFSLYTGKDVDVSLSLHINRISGVDESKEVIIFDFIQTRGGKYCKTYLQYDSVTMVSTVNVEPE